MKESERIRFIKSKRRGCPGTRCTHKQGLTPCKNARHAGSCPAGGKMRKWQGQGGNHNE